MSCSHRSVALSSAEIVAVLDALLEGFQISELGIEVVFASDNSLSSQALVQFLLTGDGP